MRKALVRIGLFVVGFIIGGLTMLKIGTEPFKSLFSENDRFETVKIIVFGACFSIGFFLIVHPVVSMLWDLSKWLSERKKRKEGEV